jgi:hypothetical protein
MSRPTTAREFWEAFVKGANVHVTSYDRDLATTLAAALGIRAGVHLGAELDRAGVSVERFVVALLHMLEPFPMMMSDLCRFFEAHGARRGREALRIAFDFDAVNEEVSFDLRHFREWQRVWERVRGVVELRLWSYTKLWAVQRIFWEALDGEPYENISDPGVVDWVAKDRGKRPDTPDRFVGAPPQPPLSGLPENVRDAVEFVYGLIAEMVAARSRFESRDELMEWRQPESERFPSSDEQMTIGEFSPSFIRQMESDYFIASLTAYLWLWVQRMRARGGDPAQASEVVARLQDLVGSLSVLKVERDALRERLEELFALPIWKQRNQLYSAWLVTVIEQAFGSFEMEVHVVDDELRLTASRPHVATFTRPDLSLEVLAEFNSPLDDPVGPRIGNIQPDYVIAAEIPVDAARALAVLEAKQYQKVSVKNFSEAAIDYARGYPHANVIVSDYGPISPHAQERIESYDPKRIRAIGDVNPLHRRSVEELMEALTANVPPPPVPSPLSSDVTSLFIDVSGSMRDWLRQPSILRELEELAERHPQLEFVAVDEAIRMRGIGRAALDLIVAMEMNHGTDLGDALIGEMLEHSAVVTDDEGEAQLHTLAVRPSVVATVGGGGLKWRSKSE